MVESNEPGRISSSPQDPPSRPGSESAAASCTSRRSVEEPGGERDKTTEFMSAARRGGRDKNNTEIIHMSSFWSLGLPADVGDGGSCSLNSSCDDVWMCVWTETLPRAAAVAQETLKKRKRGKKIHLFPSCWLKVQLWCSACGRLPSNHLDGEQNSVKKELLGLQLVEISVLWQQSWQNCGQSKRSETVRVLSAINMS